MWIFKGKYSGEAKAYLKEKQKKEAIILSLIFSITILLSLAVIAIALGNGDITLITIILGIGVGGIAFVNLIFFIVSKREPNCEIEITNDSFKMKIDDNSLSCAFYKIKTIEYHDNFIAINVPITTKLVLQKELLVEGSWEELKILLKKIEDRLDSDEPMYQIEEPETEFFEARVKEKRIYEKFITTVSIATPVGSFQYFATFELENNQEVEYEIGQEWYEKIEKDQTGTLVTVSGNFFAFGDGEDIQ